jgi:hypothetical protein
MKEYHKMCADGAAALSDLMAKTAMAERVYVFAVHGASTGPQGYGRILPMRDSEGYPSDDMAPNGFTCVSPPHADRWEAIPYDGMHGALYDACRSVPLF